MRPRRRQRGPLPRGAGRDRTKDEFLHRQSPSCARRSRDPRWSQCCAPALPSRSNLARSGHDPAQRPRTAHSSRTCSTSRASSRASPGTCARSSWRPSSSRIEPVRPRRVPGHSAAGRARPQGGPVSAMRTAAAGRVELWRTQSVTPRGGRVGVSLQRVTRRRVAVSDTARHRSPLLPQVSPLPPSRRNHHAVMAGWVVAIVRHLVELHGERSPQSGGANQGACSREPDLGRRPQRR